MRHSDFKIGTEFYTAAGKWRCTDIGTFVIVPISLESPRKLETNSKAVIQQNPRMSPKELLRGDDQTYCYENEIDEILVRLGIDDAN